MKTKKIDRKYESLLITNFNVIRERRNNPIIVDNWIICKEMKDSYTIKIGNKIKESRKNMGYTQKILAKKVGVTSKYISDIELNRFQASYEILIKICKILKVTPNQIFEEYIGVKNRKEGMYSIDGAIRYLKQMKKEMVKN